MGKINLNYQSAEARLRLPIGDKFSISAGAIYRTHDRAYGYNPVEIWLNETTACFSQLQQEVASVELETIKKGNVKKLLMVSRRCKTEKSAIFSPTSFITKTYRSF